MPKRVLCTTLMCMIVVSLAWASKSAGYGWSVGGTSILSDAKQSYSFIGTHVAIDPFDWEYMDPLVYSQVTIGNQHNLLAIHDVTSGIEWTLFRTVVHPFHRLMPTNVTAYAPSISTGLQWEMQEGLPSLRVHLSVAPLRLAEKDAVYSWFSPFITMDLSNWNILGWGVSLWQFTYIVW